MSKMGLVDISRSINYSSEICQKWDWLIYLGQKITWARYVENGIGWYILLKKLLKQDMSKMGLVDISLSSNNSSEIYQKWDWLIYLAQEITRARYIVNGIGWYISLKKLLKRNKLEIELVNISCSRNYSSKIYRKWESLINLASRNYSSKIFWLKIGLVEISCSRNYSSEVCCKRDWLIYLAQEITQLRFV